MPADENTGSQPCALHDWASSEMAMRRLSGEPIRRDAQCGLLPRVTHPAILLQAALQETFRPNSPVEMYSDAQPRFRPLANEPESLIPIDELLGQYNYRKRSIEIFKRNIAYFSNSLACDLTNLEYIVRLHEYGHALFHTGLAWSDEASLMGNYPPGQHTDWKPFLQQRSRAFRSLQSELHEFIAQLLTWMALGVVEPLAERKKLQELFVRLMERQPTKYILSDEVLGKSLYGDPTLLFAWAREPTRRKPSIRDALIEAAVELLRVGSKQWAD